MTSHLCIEEKEEGRRTGLADGVVKREQPGKGGVDSAHRYFVGG